MIRKMSAMILSGIVVFTGFLSLSHADAFAALMDGDLPSIDAGAESEEEPIEDADDPESGPDEEPADGPDSPLEPGDPEDTPALTEGLPETPPLPYSGTPAGVYAGLNYSLVLNEDGYVWAWGRGDSGQLGSGALKDSSAPLRVEGLTGARALSAGERSVIAADRKGGVYGWGDISELTGGEDADIVTAATIMPGLEYIYEEKSSPEWPEGIESLSSGDGYQLALGGDGTVWIKGESERAIPASIREEAENAFARMPGIGGVSMIAAGRTHCLALKADGSVWGWGDNRHGAIGEFDEETIPLPVLIIPGAKGSVYNSETELSLSKGGQYYLPLEGSGIATFSGVAIKVNYDQTALRLLDAAVQQPGKTLSAGPAGGGLGIEAIAEGEIVLRFDKHIPPGVEWSGLITLLQFEALRDGETRAFTSWEGQ